MNYIIHCSTCKSRSDFDTDWNGHLVETLNHPCTCPPLAFEMEDGELPRECVECRKPVKFNALRCPRCAGQHDRLARQESMDRLRAERRSAKEARMPICRCGQPVRHGKAKWCPDCKALMKGMSERKRQLMRAGELAA